jgi:hypothetical protein
VFLTINELGIYSIAGGVSTRAFEGLKDKRTGLPQEGLKKESWKAFQLSTKIR